MAAEYIQTSIAILLTCLGLLLTAVETSGDGILATTELKPRRRDFVYYSEGTFVCS